MVNDMRIVYVADPYEVGGAIESFINLIDSVRLYPTITPIILTSKWGRNNEFANSKGIENYVIGHASFYINRGSTIPRRVIRLIMTPFLFFKYIIRNYLAVRKAEKFIDFSNVDLIHTNTNNVDIGAVIAKRNNVKHVWHIRIFGELDYNCFSLRPNYIQYMNSNANAFIAISKAVKDFWVEKGLSEDKIHVVYNGIDVTKFHAINHENNDKIIKLVMSGFIAPFKGQIQVIKALRILPRNDLSRIKVVFYGHGAKEYIMCLKAIVWLFHLEEIVEFKGKVDDLSERLPYYDIGFMCSKAEAFGRVTVEYMLCGVCVIASDTGANKEIIKNGESGIIYEYNNIINLSSKISLMINDALLRENLSANAIKEAKNRFSKSKNFEYILKVYDKL